MTDRARLEQAVISIYPEIRERATSNTAVPSEAVLWKELSCCILSSQVKYPTAVAAAEAIAEKGALLSHEPVTPDALRETLAAPLSVEGRQVRYRFARSKAQQLSEAHAAINAQSGGLSAKLESFDNGEHARRWFVQHAPGLGPKQASMFLRNTGMTYDLAVLDRHVVEYMDYVGLHVAGRNSTTSSLAGYTSREAVLKSYAQGLGMAVGLMDWAIWIVMRVFKGHTELSA